MPSPFEVLDLEPNADQERIRKRYLDLVRQNPPEHAAQRFAEIQDAYDKLRDPENRVKALLFDHDEQENVDSLIRDLIHERTSRRWPTDALLALGEKPA